MGLFGAVEAGGTKFVCAIGSGPDDIQTQVRIPTTNPTETLRETINFFNDFMNHAKYRLSGIGIGTFGPIELNPKSPQFGKITTTPKPGWSNADILHAISAGTGIRAVIDTDVNAAAFGEGKWGAAQGLDDFVYFTIGTGIGGGLIIQGRPHHGLVHPEMGHIHLVQDPVKDPFQSVCPFHGDCFEGLASGTALRARYGDHIEALPMDHPAWDIEADYIAQALSDIICTLSPQKIILGGGVMQQKQLFPLIHRKTQEWLNGYVQSPLILDNIKEYIVPPGLGNMAGILGCIALAMDASDGS